MADLDDRLTLAFAEFLCVDRGRLWTGDPWGGPGYYGVRVAAVTSDAAEVELAVTFRAGVTYCCFESSCHFPHHASGWQRLRECLDRHDLAQLPLPIIRTFRGVIEPGAVMQPEIGPGTRWVHEGAQYTNGPRHPITTRHAEPGAAPDPAR
ncbi:hypothetical protein J8F10_12440 [Gemmata sp. G18]|uniref:Uncharacterized protein n=1 Tax=Gemmata palustris TaxID=2822762 RepID=A0ABS5BQU2_9BACT|nr:hypothetical protein [Gemmata palustris]MBP3956091.1 hypothetical protein [Gemmata palustris]